MRTAEWKTLCTEVSIINQSKNVWRRQQPQQNTKEAFMKLGLTGRGKRKDRRSSKVMLSVNEDVRHQNIRLSRVPKNLEDQKFMPHVNYANLLFSSKHTYAELGSLMWWGFDAHHPQGLDLLMRTGCDSPAKSQSKVGCLSLTYLLTPSKSQFSMWQ